MKPLLSLLLLVACAATPADRAFDEAQQLAHGRDQERVRDLYRLAATGDPDPVRREKAALRAANLEWRVFRDTSAARALLSRTESCDAHLERGRIALEVDRDFGAARDSARKALAAAKTKDERQRATIFGARIAVEEVPPSAAALREAIRAIESTIEATGPRVQTARLLLRAAILAHDDATALRALRWYYADVAHIVPATLPTRESLGRTLARLRLYQEAAMVLDDPEIDRYAATLERIEAIANEHYRLAATGDESPRRFEKLVRAELPKDAGRRFGTVYTLGETDNVSSLHYGHRVLDEQRAVEQYGRRGTIRFVLLDNMISNGYMLWILDGTSGAGGWNDEKIVYQVRPMYANGPVRAWTRMTDPEARAKWEKELAEETRRDTQRAKTNRLGPFPGLEMRMETQYAEGVRASLAAQGLSGDALRDAFIARVRREEFDSSIWAHEGRHSIDRTQLGIDDTEELEYRAKLSQIAFAASPRMGLANGVLSPVGDGTPHGEANERVLEGLLRVLKLKDLTKLDALTDEQLRNGARALDPLARVPSPRKRGEGGA